ncbi:unnamed protein product [[Candida] boidinii]|nr:unnamed protein product [[Candida] boidinii]
MQSLSSFIGELHQIDISTEQINTFCRAIFTRIPDDLVPRVQRFLQRVHEYQISTQNQQTQQMRRNAEPNVNNVANETQTQLQQQQQQQQQQRPQRQHAFLQQQPVNRQHRRQPHTQQQQQLLPAHASNLTRQTGATITDEEFWPEREFTFNDPSLGMNGPVITFRQLMAILQRNNIPVSPENSRRLVESIRRNEVTVQELLDPNINIGNRRINIVQPPTFAPQQNTQQQESVNQDIRFPAGATPAGTNNDGGILGAANMGIPDDGADVDSDEPMED